MNAVWIALGMMLFLGLGYLLYGGFIERRLVEPDDSRACPAVAQRDGIDYEPAIPFVLFGHHFSSIAGAGPIVGPILGIVLFGWGAVAGWIVLGTIFIGGVHDYLSLLMSCRSRGQSVAEIAEDVISPRASRAFAVFLWCALVLVIAVFGVLGAKALMSAKLGPPMVFPTFMVLFIAMFLGVALRRRLLPLWLATLLAVVSLLACIYVGYAYLPLTLPQLLPFINWTETAVAQAWFGILMLYCLVASVLPVWFLLQPRDYISVFTLFFGMAAGVVGLLLAHPVMRAPFFTGWVGMDKSGAQPLWPMLFVIVACGAVSGFHSVVAGGTTSKQLPRETVGRRIGYGAMVLEGMLATLVLCLVGGGLYWSAAQAGNELHVDNVMKSGGALVVFAQAFGEVLHRGIALVPVELAALFGMVMLKTFVLTTLDTCTRLARFVVAEQLGDVWAIFRSRSVATIVTLIPAFILGFSGAWQTIWPVFGAANQLIAALTLLVISCYLLGVKKPSIYAAIPAMFMLATTIAALGYQAVKFATHRSAEGTAQPQWLLATVAVLLIVLAVSVFGEVWRVTKGFKKPARELVTEGAK